MCAVEKFNFNSITPKMSIIVCFNDKLVFRENLLKSLSQQIDFPFELLAVSNVNKRFLSVTSAYNYGAQKAKGDFLMFVHQDIYLQGEHWLNNAFTFLQFLPKAGVVGVSGVTSDGNPKGFIIDRGKYFGVQFNEPFPVQTIDEQLMIIPRKVFDKITFDEDFTFHSYGADYSLSVQKVGLKVYVLPLIVEHNSLTIGTLSASNLQKQDQLLAEKHKHLWKKIHKTTGTVGTKKDLLRQTVVSKYPCLLSSVYSLVLNLWAVNLEHKRILDIGCIPLEQANLVKQLLKKEYSIGISSKRRYLIVSKKLGIHNAYVIADEGNLPFHENSFDFALLSGLLEYFPKNKSELILQSTKKIAKNILIKVPSSGSPVDSGHFIFDSSWKSSDFKKEGFKTCIIGLKRIMPQTLIAYWTK